MGTKICFFAYDSLTMELETHVASHRLMGMWSDLMLVGKGGLLLLFIWAHKTQDY